MDTIKNQVQKVVDTARFEGITFDVVATPDSRLSITARANASLDLPQDLDVIVAEGFNLLRGALAALSPSTLSRPPSA